MDVESVVVVCIDELISSGTDVCTSNIGNCSNGKLSDVLTDHQANILISNLKAKCPMESCSHEYEWTFEIVLIVCKIIKCMFLV